MSTLEENSTLIPTPSGDIKDNLVKIADASFSSAQNFDVCGNSDDKEDNLKNIHLPSVNINAIIRQPKFENFGDLVNDAGRLGAGSEEPDEKISSPKETLQCDEELIVDVKPTVLHKDTRDLDWINGNSENFTITPKTCSTAEKKRKRFSDFFKSLCVLCDICDDINTQRVIKLNRQERIVAAVILRKSFGIGLKTNKIFPTKIPEQTCCRCFTKIILLYNRHKNKYSQKRVKKEAAQDMDQPSHGYHCLCPTCQNQYGALPVLLKGIEEQNKMQSQNSQSQVNFQSEHLSLTQLIDPQHTAQPQEQVNFQQYLVKYEAESFPTQLQGQYQTAQSSTSDYTRFQMPDSQMEVNFQPTSKTEIDLSQTSRIFNEPRLNIDQSQFDVNYQDQPEYYGAEGNVVISGHVLDESSQEQNLPTLLQELEEKCQTELASQPSTSSGLKVQSYSQDDKQSKKIMTCEHCDKNFTHKGDFNKHQRKHTKEKPYKCSFCDKMFSHTSNLHRHQRIHSGDRPFKCQYCDKCFNRKDKLENHKNSKICKNRRN